MFGSCGIRGQARPEPALDMTRSTQKRKQRCRHIYHTKWKEKAACHTLKIMIIKKRAGELRSNSNRKESRLSFSLPRKGKTPFGPTTAPARQSAGNQQSSKPRRPSLVPHVVPKGRKHTRTSTALSRAKPGRRLLFSFILCCSEMK